MMYEKFQGGGRPAAAEPESAESLEDYQSALLWIGSLYWTESDFTGNTLNPALAGNLVTITNAFAPVQIFYTSDENLRADYSVAIASIVPPFDPNNPRANTVVTNRSPGRVLTAAFYKTTRNQRSLAQSFAAAVTTLNAAGGTVLQNLDNAINYYSQPGR